MAEHWRMRTEMVAPNNWLYRRVLGEGDDGELYAAGLINRNRYRRFRWWNPSHLLSWTFSRMTLSAVMIERD